MSKKNQLYRLHRTESSKSQSKTYKNKLISILRSAENAYYSELLAEQRGHVKETLAILNTVICKQHPTIKCPIHIMCGNRDVSTNTNMAGEFSKLFATVGSNLVKTHYKS